jgi:hypothetical protein
MSASEHEPAHPGVPVAVVLFCALLTLACLVGLAVGLAIPL